MAVLFAWEIEGLEGRSFHGFLSGEQNCALASVGKERKG